MNEILLCKLDELYKELNDCSLIKEMIELKNNIYKDSSLKDLLGKYRSYSNKYDPDFIKIKTEITNNPLIKRYRELENELYFITLEINQKLNDFIGKKRCSNENN